MCDTTFLTPARLPKGRRNAFADGEAMDTSEMLKLRESGFCRGIALPHDMDENRNVKRLPYYPYNRLHAPSSTLTSTVDDLKLFGSAATNALELLHFERATQKESEVPNNGESMGLGWFIRKQAGYDLYGHEGSDDGFRTSFWVCPELKITIAVTANKTNASVKRVNKQLFEFLCQ
jgi:CubicO group peptidase (beta-lactamase class C family)